MKLLETLALVEAQNYIGMFTDFINAAPNSKPIIDRYVKWAQTTLKKNDRIVWFLRFVRVELAGSARYSDSDAELQKLNRKLGTNYSRHDLIPINNLMTNLTHFLAMPIDSIQKLVWLKQSPLELINEFSALEAEGRETADDDVGAQEMSRQNRLIERDTRDRIIIRCPDGFCWVDLEQGSCPIEARAMGHCGNGGGSYSDNILSLRKPVTYRGDAYWYPVATFILKKGGMLGEMKGRNNDKPTDRYHADIILLLKSKYVVGIIGGGYLPENNFSMDDLDDEVRDQLLEEKPLLGGFYNVYRKEGMTATVQGYMEDALEAKGINGPEKYLPESRDFVLETWPDFDQFLREINTDMEKLYDIATGQDEDAIDTSDSRALFTNMVHELPTSWHDAIIKKAKQRNLDEAIETLIRQRDPWYELFIDVLRDFHHRENIAWDRLEQYVQQGFHFVSYHVFTNIPHDNLREWLATKPVIELLIAETDLVGIASADDDDDEYSSDIHNIAQNGWASLDSDRDYYHDVDVGERLVDRNGNDIWLASGAGQHDNSMAEMFIDAVNGGRQTTIDDPRQTEINFESVGRLKELAGLR